MPLVPLDFPNRLAARGLRVHVVSGWENRGGSADHQAVVFHWTASSPNESPSSCANYCFVAADDAPHYNVLVDRAGEVWVGARNKANSSGKISGTALQEVLAGHADWRSAASRGLSDTTSANDRLWAISMQNNGTGEPMAATMIDAMALVCAVSLECLGRDGSSWTTHHAALTARKVDVNAGPGGCPDGGTWNRKITDALTGGDDDEMKEADFDRIKAETQQVVTNVLRSEGVSGAKHAADVFSDEEKADIQRIVTDVGRKEGWGSSSR